MTSCRLGRACSLPLYWLGREASKFKVLVVAWVQDKDTMRNPGTLKTLLGFHCMDFFPDEWCILLPPFPGMIKLVQSTRVGTSRFAEQSGTTSCC